ncbi:AAA family ATPase [bacterium]|nr:AAA family ATPase [bacterium]
MTSFRDPDTKIPRRPFRLDPSKQDEPSEFRFLLLVNELIYEYEFSISNVRVLSERLTEINSSSETVLFERSGNSFHIDSKVASKSKAAFLMESSKANQLFLTNGAYLKVSYLLPIYEWFKYKLVLIAPNWRFSLYDIVLKKDDNRFNSIILMLCNLDTGIVEIQEEEVSNKSVLPFDKSFLDHLESELHDGDIATLISSLHKDIYTAKKVKDGVLFHKLITIHENAEGDEIPFDLSVESDGTLRALDLLPALDDASSGHSDQTYVIDEIDRSLHSLLVREMLQSFLTRIFHEWREHSFLKTILTKS